MRGKAIDQLVRIAGHRREDPRAVAQRGERHRIIASLATHALRLEALHRNRGAECGERDVIDAPQPAGETQSNFRLVRDARRQRNDLGIRCEWTGFADRTNHHPRAVCSLNKSFNPSEHLPHPTRAFAQPRPRGLESGEEAARFLTHVRE